MEYLIFFKFFAVFTINLYVLYGIFQNFWHFLDHFFLFFKKSISRFTKVILWLGSAELAMINYYLLSRLGNFLLKLATSDNKFCIYNINTVENEFELNDSHYPYAHIWFENRIILRKE